MKRLTLIIAAVVFSLACTAEDRPITPEQLPAVAKSFIENHFPSEKISFAKKDDDFVRPDFTVILSNGVELQFGHDGSFEKIESKVGVPEGIVPVQISDYVKAHSPNSVIVEYEITKRYYEVKLSNGFELVFNGKYNLVELDD